MTMLPALSREGETWESAGSAPALPAEHFVVQAALWAREARDKADLLMNTLASRPRDLTVVGFALRDLQHAAGQAESSYDAYTTVRTCVGQA